MLARHTPVLLLVVFLLISACAAKTVSTPSSPPNATRDDTPRILFLAYKIVAQDSGASTIQLTKQINTAGVLKEKTPPSQQGQTGDLQCRVFDATQQPISSFILPNPLQKSVEYQDENGSLARKEIQLSEAEFLIRLQLDPAMHTIAIHQIGQEEKTLLTTTIDH